MMVILVKSVLIVAKTQQSITPLSELLEEEGYCCTATAFSSQEAKKQLNSGTFDLIVINAPLCDCSGLELSYYMADNTRAGVLLLIKSEALPRYRDSLEDHGVFPVPKPISRGYFHQTVKMWEVSKRRLMGLEKENLELKNQVEEIKLVNRAKLVLMRCLAMSEPQAHRYLEKQAMDMRESKRKVAEQVLNTYES